MTPVVRFFRSGGGPMLAMMNGAPDDHAHHDHAHHGPDHGQHGHGHHEHGHPVR
ncbi:MAG TPA: hypothetical protein VF204_24575 [Streptosporangiaceae bacterium]